ncbi:3-oxoacyl-[acyl-carrier-protein] reductase FabG [Andreesenia angusta]|uniref:3-oxoacyl-[acyl-carrier-protein] reductase n=1 Tax=Andreesenia angusta TaxID=39480 RepID=A0A1S1V7X2_9FIRM|nr:3-oxoacyl-[acyl-carrier-protein] reductase [Andreesenia angusta]OHW62672.1 3-oxoacyl-[acyl-carrier-protein] reductase FabG [Andreesenia angusta]
MECLSLEGKVSLVTGGARGLGKSIALKLASLGSDVVINDIGGEESAMETISEIESMGRKAVYIKADISKFEEAKSLVEQSVEQIGKIDVLVNNAGITRDNLIMRMSEEDFDAVINVNLKGTFNVSKAAIRGMLKTKNCSIINVSSVVGVAGNAGQTNYAASKAGVIGFTKSLAKEVAKKNVRVNAVAPGFIETDMTDKLPEEIIEGYKQNIPLGSLGSPEDVSNTVAFLASDMSKYITGQVIVVDGGLFI